MADVAPQPSPTTTGANGTSDNSGSGNGSNSPGTAAPDTSRPPSTRSSPRSPNSGILLPVLASEGTPGRGGGPSASPPGSFVVGGATTPAAMSPSSYPPRSAAISSRRGRSRSPTTALVGDRRGSNLSASSIHSGHLMHKHPVTIPDHPAEMIKKSSPARGSSDGSSSSNNKSTVKQTDSRDDEQGRLLGSNPASLPENVSSAAAAAAAAAASFTAAAANANNSKTSRSKRGYDGTGNEASAQPPQKQGRTTGQTSKSSSGGGTAGAWPDSPSDHAKKGEAPAVTSSSSAGLSPIKLEEKGEEEPLMDFSASPLGPPEIQNSNRDDRSFSPKNIFGDEKVGSKSSAPPPPPANGPGGFDMSSSFNLFSHSFDSLGGVMHNLDALNSFGGIGATGSDGVAMAPVPSISLSFLQNDSSKSPKSTKKEGGKGNEQAATAATKKTSKKGKDDLSRADILSGSPIKLSGLSPSSSFVMPVGGENAAMADLVLNGGSVATGGLIDDTYDGRPKYRSSAAPGHGPASYSHHPGQQQYHGYGGRYDPTQGHPTHGYVQQIPPTVGSPLEGAPAFYFVLRRWRKCFGRFTFLLPGLKVRETCSVNVSAVGGITLTNGSSKKNKASGGALPYTDPRGKRFPDPNPAEIEIATRRVIAAVCAFGGSVQRAATPSRQTSSSSIFRTKYTGSSLPKTKQQLAYEERLPKRYYENNNRLSWEVEDSPPVVISSEEEESETPKNKGSTKKGSKNTSASSGGKGKSTSPSPSPTHGSSGSVSGDPPKMKYRCKLCGQPKQNHVCLYQQALQRSIGIMCYPAVNAYSSVEPGRVAPALADMNNFTGTDDAPPFDSTSPRMSMGPNSAPNNVTPESLRSSLNRANSPDSLLSGTPDTISRQHGYGAGYFSPHQRQMKRGEYSKMRGFGTELPSHPLFKEPMDMRREQFRAVSSPKNNSKQGAYTYPSLPLTYSQRKRLSDSLFAMSKEVPGLTDECAIVLREGRQKQKWDLAVAELLTQVVITVHCRDGDNTLEGLRQYLLTLGIAC